MEGVCNRESSDSLGLPEGMPGTGAFHSTAALNECPRRRRPKTRNYTASVWVYHCVGRATYI